MNTIELIHQETKDLPETDAREVLDFIKFIKAKRWSISGNKATSQATDMSELDQFGSVYDGHFDRDECYDRPELR